MVLAKRLVQVAAHVVNADLRKRISAHEPFEYLPGTAGQLLTHEGLDHEPKKTLRTKCFRVVCDSHERRGIKLII